MNILPKPLVMKRYHFVILIFGCLTLSGCFLELAELGEVGMADTALTAGEGAALEASSLELAEGRLTLANEASLEKIEMFRAPGENPKLYVRGNAEPFAEVFSREERARLLGRHAGEFAISENVFSVEGDVVNVRDGQVNGNIITRVHHGNLVVVLSEEDGWYQVKIAQNGGIVTGWIKGLYLLPLVGEKRKHKFENARANYKDKAPLVMVYPDSNKIESDLIGKSIPNWRFDRISEFLSLKVDNQQLSNPYLYQDIDILLQSENKRYKAQIKITYSLQGNQWQFNNVIQTSFAEIDDVGVYTPTQPVVTYNAGYLLRYHQYVPSSQIAYRIDVSGRNYANDRGGNDFRRPNPSPYGSRNPGNDLHGRPWNNGNTGSFRNNRYTGKRNVPVSTNRNYRNYNPSPSPYHRNLHPQQNNTYRQNIYGPVVPRYSRPNGYRPNYRYSPSANHRTNQGWRH
jgi:hypothetical protein